MSPCPRSLSLERALPNMPMIRKPRMEVLDDILDSYSKLSTSPAHSAPVSPTSTPSELSLEDEEHIIELVPLDPIARHEEDEDVATNISNATTAEVTIKADETTNNNRRRAVSFSQVQIRRYPMILGDNPACRIGAPVSLGWEFEVLPDLDIDDYEAFREKHRRTHLNHLILNYYQRIKILQSCGVTMDQFKQAERQAARVHRQRSISLALSPFEKVEQIAVSGAKKVRRCLRRHNCDVCHDKGCRNEKGHRAGRRGLFRRQNANV